MAGKVAALRSGSRITDFVSFGILARAFPIAKVHEALAATGKASQRQRDLPAHVVVYYVLALSLYMQSSSREVLRCLLEGLQWLKLGAPISIAGKSGISQARSRLGSAVMRHLHDTLVGPVAGDASKGAWYRDWRLVSLDGSTLDVADEPSNDAAFGRPGAGHGEAAFPQIRFVSLVENGTHVLFGSQMSGCGTSEQTLGKEVLPALKPGMLCLADRNFFGHEMWTMARATGADLVWRVRKNARLSADTPLPDGSYISHIYPSEKDRRHKSRGTAVRVVNYALDGVDGAEDIYRLVTTILDAEAAPAHELAALYHERWEIETALDELKTHLRGARIVLRSRTPDLVRQEFYGLMMLHYAVRGVMHEAAIKADIDPDRLSFLHAVRVIRRKSISAGAIPPSKKIGMA
jgi:Insertion element 4 transposase N-terminal/Transposase DDE domain